MAEIHRYFPEWADRPNGPDAQLESDRNSYLAGGYADEFGYGVDPGRPPAIAALTGDPESSRLWREQIGALHPGYPQCPKPVDRDLPEAVHAVLAISTSPPAPHGEAHFQVIRVSRRDRPPAGRAALRLGVLSFLAERLIRRRHLDDVL